MSPQSLLITAASLGLYVLFGGAFATCYAIGQIRHARSFSRMALAFLALQVAVAIGVVAFAPLGAGWKMLILISTGIYALVPPFTLRYLQRIHAS